jgi:glucokinase
MEKIIVGFDIGGTKCASVVARVTEEKLQFLEREQFKTEGNWQGVIDKLCNIAKAQLDKNNINYAEVCACGISCGGPMDSKKGLILSPPNLIGWDNVHICEYIKNKIGWDTYLKNDADACALAEWKYGAGRGYENVIFLTFGTGLGAGLVLGGRLYSGTNNMAGEVGHIRLEKEGPVGYGKRGSFEGFCSGGGIMQQANTYFTELEQQGIKVDYYQGLNSVSAKLLGEKARQGDIHAIDIYSKVGEYFGKGLSVLIDILNPEVIIAGGIFMRDHELITPKMYEVLKKECLPLSLAKVKIVPSQLKEQIGDYAAIVAAL